MSMLINGSDVKELKKLVVLEHNYLDAILIPVYAPNGDRFDGDSLSVLKREGGKMFTNTDNESQECNRIWVPDFTVAGNLLAVFYKGNRYSISHYHVRNELDDGFVELRPTTASKGSYLNIQELANELALYHKRHLTEEALFIK